MTSARRPRAPAGVGASARAIEIRWRWPPDSDRSPDVACRSVMPTDLRRSSASWRDSAFDLLLHWTTASSTASSGCWRGSSEPYGSWKIIWTFQRLART